MIVFEMNDAQSRKIVTLFFAFLSAVTATSTALAPAILHI